MSNHKSLSEQSRILEKRLQAISPEIVREVQPALIKGAGEVAGMMRVFAPIKDGDLRDSITVTPPGGTTPAYAEGGGKRVADENQALVTVGNEDVRHGHLQEFGTAHHEARPFVRPGTRLAQPKVKRRISRAIGAAIRKAAKGKA